MSESSEARPSGGHASGLVTEEPERPQPTRWTLSRLADLAGGEGPPASGAEILLLIRLVEQAREGPLLSRGWEKRARGELLAQWSAEPGLRAVSLPDDAIQTERGNIQLRAALSCGRLFEAEFTDLAPLIHFDPEYVAAPLRPLHAKIKKQDKLLWSAMRRIPKYFEGDERHPGMGDRLAGLQMAATRAGALMEERLRLSEGEAEPSPTGEIRLIRFLGDGGQRALMAHDLFAQDEKREPLGALTAAELFAFQDAERRRLSHVVSAFSALIEGLSIAEQAPDPRGPAARSKGASL